MIVGLLWYFLVLGCVPDLVTCFSGLVIISVLCSGAVGLMLLRLALVCYDCYVCRLFALLCWLFVRIFVGRVFGFGLVYFGCAYWLIVLLSSLWLPYGLV